MNYLSENDFSESEEEEIAEYPEWLEEEDKLYNKLHIINNFKNLIDKEPNFYGIRNLSDVDILMIFENSSNNNNQFILNDVEHYYFNNVWLNLFNYSKDNYNNVAYNIINKIQINK